jgi:hypothetical protein
MERRLEEYFETTRIVKITNLTLPLSKKRDKNKKAADSQPVTANFYPNSSKISADIINSRIFRTIMGASLGVVIKTT